MSLEYYVFSSKKMVATLQMLSECSTFFGEECLRHVIKMCFFGALKMIDEQMKACSGSWLVWSTKNNTVLFGFYAETYTVFLEIIHCIKFSVFTVRANK